MKNIILLLNVHIYILYVKASDSLKSISTIKICNSNQWQDFQDQQCRDCNQNCNSCYGDFCLDCKVGTTADGEQCLNQVQDCELGYYFDYNKKKCTSCQIPFCKICKNEFQCEECQSDFKKDDNFKCKWTKFSQDDQSYLKLIEQKDTNGNNIQLKPVCPPNFFENSVYRTCQSFNQQLSQSKFDTQDQIDNDIIIQVLYYNTNSTLIVLQKNFVKLLNRKDLSLSSNIFSLLQQQDEAGNDQENEQIQNGILFENILIIFTNKQIVSFDLKNNQFVNSFPFIQGPYNLDQQKRLFIDTQNKTIHYLHFDKDQKNLFIAILQLNFKKLQQIQDFSIISQIDILLDLPEKVYISANYIPERNYLLTDKEKVTNIIKERQIIITSQENVYILEEKSYVEKCLNESKTNSTNSTKFTVIFFQGDLQSFQIPPTTFNDDCEEDDEDIFLLRHQVNFFYLLKLEIDEKQKKVILKSSIFQQDSDKYLTMIAKFYVNNIDNVKQIYFIVIKIPNETKNQDNSNMIVYPYIEINLAKSNFDDQKHNRFYYYQEFIKDDDQLSNFQFYYFMSPQTQKQILVLNVKNQVLFYSPNFKDIYLGNPYVLDQGLYMKTQFSLILPLLDTTEDCDFQLVIPSNFATIQSACFKGPGIVIKQSKMNQFQNKEQLFFVSPELIQNNLMKTKVIKDEQAQMLFVIQLLKSDQFIIYQIDLIRNQLVSSNIFSMKLGSRITFTFYIKGKNLVLFFINLLNNVDTLYQIYLIQAHTLKLLDSFSFYQNQQLILTVDQPYDVVLRLNQPYIILFQIEDDSIDIYNMFDSIKFDQTHEIFIYTNPKNKNCFAFAYVFETQYVTNIYCNKKLIYSAQQLTNNKCQFNNNNALICFYITQGTYKQQLYQSVQYQIQFQSEQQVIDIGLHTFGEDIQEGEQEILMMNQLIFYQNQQNQIIILPSLSYNESELYIRIYNLNSFFEQMFTFECQDVYLDLGNFKYFLDFEKQEFNFLIPFYEKTESTKYLYSISYLYVFDEIQKKYVFRSQNKFYNLIQNQSLALEKLSQVIDNNDIYHIKQIKDFYIIHSGFNPSFFLQKQLNDSINDDISYNYDDYIKQQMSNILNYQQLEMLNYFDNENFVFFQDIPQSSDLMQYTQKYNPDTIEPTWIYSQSLELIISIERNEDLSKKILFLTIDNFEQMFSQIDCLKQSYIFWFEKQQILVIIQQYQILSYKILGGKLEKFQIQDQIQGIDLEQPHFLCIQAQNQAIVFCSKFGLYDVLKNEFKFEKSILISSDKIGPNYVKENNKFIVFGNKIYDIQENQFSEFNSLDILNIQFIQLSQTIQNQGFYYDNNSYDSDCFIFQLPSFNIIYKASSQNYKKSKVICLFHEQTNYVMIYYQQYWLFHKLPISYIVFSLEIEFQIYIENNEINYFQDKTKITIVGNLLVGYYMQSQYTISFLIIDIELKSKKIYYGFTIQQNEINLVRFWPEKKLLLTGQGILQFLDINISLNIYTSPDIRKQNRIYYSENYNYIITDSTDFTGIFVLNISQMFPINKNNFLFSSRFQAINNNIYEIINNSDSLLENKLIYFDYESNNIIEKKSKFTFSNENNQKIIKSESNQQNTLFNLYEIDFKNIDKPQTYKIVEFTQDNLKYYILQFKCKLILFQSLDSLPLSKLHEISLLQYNCKLWGGGDVNNGYSSNQHFSDQSIISKQIKKYFLVQNQEILYELQIVDKKFYNKMIVSFDIQSGYFFRDLMIWNNQSNEKDTKIFYLIVIFQKQQQDQFQFISIDEGQKDQQILDVQIPNQQITCINMLQINNEVFVLVGTNQQIQIYQYKKSEVKLEFQKDDYFQIEKRGSINNILVTNLQVQNQDNSISINIYTTSKSRISLFQLNYDKQNNKIKIQLKEENLIHARSPCHIKVLIENKILVVFDRFQANIYYNSLKLIGRVEENDIQIINNVQMAEDKFTLLVTSTENVLVYDLRRVSSKNKFLLQYQMNYTNPIIYQISSIKTQKDSRNLLIFFGYNIKGYMYTKYYPKESDAAESVLNTQDYNKNIEISTLPDNLFQQEELFKQMIINEEGFETVENNSSYKVKYVYFRLTGNSQEIFIPSNLLGMSSQYQKNKLDIRIDLNNKTCQFRQHSIDQNVNFISSFYVQNGKVDLDKDINLQSLQNFVFSDIKLNFNYTQINILNSQSITFNSLLIYNNIISDYDRFSGIKDKSLSQNYSPQIIIQNSTNINIINTNILRVSYQRDLFLISNCENVLISNMKIQKSSFFGSIFIFNEKTKNIQIQDVILLNSFVLQLIAIYEAQNLTIKQVQISQIKQYEETKIVRILQTAEKQQILDLKQNLYDTFIYIQLVQIETIIKDIVIKDNSKLNSLIDYSNSFKYIIEVKSNDTNSKIQTFSHENISLNSKLNLKNIIMMDTNFAKFAIQINETQVSLQKLYSFNCLNSSILIQNTIKGLQMSQIKFIENTFFDKYIIKVKNSIIHFQNMNFTKNNLISQKNYSSIVLSSCDYSLDNIFAQFNNFSSNFIFISNFFDKNQDYKSDFFQNNQRNSLRNLQILNNSMRAIQIKNQQYQENQLINIYKSTLQYNNLNKTLEQGGAIYFSNVNSILVDVNILNNTAKISGGGIYYENSDLKMIRCSIESNSALMGGGVRYCNSNKARVPYFIKTNIANNNASIFGKEYGSYPRQIQILNSTLNDIPSSVNQKSFTITFQLLGEHGEIVKFDNNSAVQMNSTEVQQLKIFHLKPNNELIEEEDKQPKENALIQIKSQDNSQAIKEFSITAYIVNSGYKKLKTADKSLLKKVLFDINRKVLTIWGNQFQLSHDFTITFKNCSDGELIQQIQTYYYECYSCQGNTFQVGNPYDKVNDTQCKQCPSNTLSCKDNRITPQEKYWNEQGTSFVGYCQNAPNKCTQKNSTKDGCIEGAYGPLCESCDYDGVYNNGIQTYAKRNHYDCTKCGNFNDNLQKYLLSGFLIAIFIAYVTYQIFSNAFHKINKLQAYTLKKLGLITISSTLNEREKTSTTLKILISYIQIVSVIQNFHLNYPDYINQIVFFIGNVLEISFYYLDCMFIDLNLNKKVKMIYLRLMWTVISSFFYCILLLIVGLFLQKKMHLVNRKRNLLVSGILQLYYMIYPSLIKQTIGTICCKTINGKKYILLDSQYECYDQDYIYFNLFLSAPVLLLTLLIPLFLLKQLQTQKNQKKLLSNYSYLNFGFFYCEYRREKYYWEIIRIYHKMFVYCIISIFNQSNQISGILVSLSIIFYMKYLQISKPYEQNLFNQLEILSQLTAIITIFGAIINTQQPSLENYAIAVIVIVNIIFIFRSIICLSQLSINKLNCPLILQNIRNKYPNIFGFKENKHNNIFRVTKNWKLVKFAVRSLRLNQLIPFSQRTMANHSQNMVLNQQFSSGNQLLPYNYSQVKSPQLKQQEILFSSPQQEYTPLKESPNDIGQAILNSPTQQLQLDFFVDTECNFEEQIDKIILNQTKEIQQVQQKKQ